MTFFDNNNSGVNFGYPLGTQEFQNFGAPYYPLLDSDTPVAGASGSQDWYLNLSLRGMPTNPGIRRVPFWTRRGTSSWVDPYALHTVPAHGGFDACESCCC